MNTLMKSTVAAAAFALAGHAVAQVTFYERENFQGRSFTTDRPVGDFDRAGFNDRASSVVVDSDRWEACEDLRFGGRCVVLRQGKYPSLAAMGLNDRISSVRAAGPEARANGNDDNRDNRNTPALPVARVTFYENDNFQGRAFTTEQPVGDFTRFGFNDRASSVLVEGDRWQACEDVRFGGRCVVLRPGAYASLGAMRLDNKITSVRALARDVRVNDNQYAPTPVVSQAVFYERPDFGGRSLTVVEPLDNFRRSDFDNRANSVMVTGGSWELCEDMRFNGRCVVLRPGRYPSLTAMGLADRVSSVRAVRSDTPVNDNRRPVGERLFEAHITSARAVLGAAEQRCWVEPDQVVQNQGNPNVGGAVVGALLGGVLGHQVGGGTGKDLATVGGVIAGAVIGSNVGRDGTNPPTQTQNMQRCASTNGQARPSYWDVTYTFRGLEHRVQMTTQPGATIMVNDQGEPRV